ncbi:hypothetical protein [Pseudobacteroides cellulosolvens]|uniref:Yip1 domain-containing protein n=1 Tax=Pseudobacteroides cellulosolvens ATCC 35603 = DSM 2933 TaxID=398512 RepID=A0A0L6JN25_9FIRM|nr:hypothetical protein [Pseudobacteroides cellulosolvens]KNY27179.1 hypothetical protein Bccel_2447 [Pseudobacteroides cellulosolvens ATCC 35603 = DSM 2933]
MFKNFFNLILLPEKFYKKFTDRIITLIIGVFALGIIDYIFSISEKLHSFFVDKTSVDLSKNIFYSLVVIVIFGIGDVVFFSFPVSDIIKRLKSDKDTNSEKSSQIKIMKVQILANCIIFIPTLVLTYLSNGVDPEKNIELSIIIMYVYLIIQIWLCAIITRGIKSAFEIGQRFKPLIFPIVFFWYYIVGMALNFVMEKLMGLVLV